MKPNTVSLLITTYNWKEALRLTLLSAFAQTIPPTEIIIADDGSREDTRMMIEEMRIKTSIPIKHVWQPDEGFRLAKIRNKGLAKAIGEYIIQIDGDVILHKHFVRDHLEASKENFFVCGSRVKLDKTLSEKVLSLDDLKLSFWSLPLSYAFNSLRIKYLRKYMELRYARTIEHLRGCNMAFWKADIIKVNGYNEDLTDWGHEDSELAYRLHHADVKKKALKMGGIVYHLWHKEASKTNEHSHVSMIELVKRKRLAWCENGINKCFVKS